MAQTQVKGDLIIEDSGRIMTRSRAKQRELDPGFIDYNIQPDWKANEYSQDPDRYTIIPASLKILKVLIEELLSASGAQAAPNAAAAAAAKFADADEDDGDDGWEDEPGDVIDLPLGGSEADLLRWGAAEGASNSRERDDETQQYLSDFFIRAATENIANFNEWFTMLSDDEKAKLQQLAGGGN